MGKDREVPEEVKQNRREIADSLTESHIKAVRDGDQLTADEILGTMKALKLVVPDEYGRLVTGPNVADD